MSKILRFDGLDFDVNVYGLENIEENTDNLIVLYLAHTRLGDYKVTEKLALKILESIKKKNKNNVIAVTFDLWNHGSRMGHIIHNKDWKEGNENHGNDMLKLMNTSVDDFLTISNNLLSKLNLNNSNNNISVSNIVIGISLGGHIAWRLASKIQSTIGLVSIIGSPFLQPLLTDRLHIQRYSDLPKDKFNPTSDENIKEWNVELDSIFKSGDNDTMNLLLPPRPIEDNNNKRLKIGITCGSQDELVPLQYSEHWIDLNKDYKEEVELFVDECGHECSESMVQFCINFVEKLIN